MSPTQFTAWLYGFVQLTGGQQPTAAQWRLIVEHLRLAGQTRAEADALLCGSAGGERYC